MFGAEHWNLQYIWLYVSRCTRAAYQPPCVCTFHDLSRRVPFFLFPNVKLKWFPGMVSKDIDRGFSSSTAIVGVGVITLRTTST